MTTPAGWYPDTTGLPVQRYWDGRQWTTATAPPVGAVPPPGERRITIHYGFALLAVLAVLGTAIPCLALVAGNAGAEDPDVAGAGVGMAVMWGLWGGMWILIWSAFAIHHTLKSRH